MTAVNLNRAVRGPVTAVPIVAGKGVKLVADTENNRWVIEADETVLWEGSSRTNIQLSETITNFEEIVVYLDEDGTGNRLIMIRATPINANSLGLCGVNYIIDDPSNPVHIDVVELSISSGVVSIVSAFFKYMNASSTTMGNFDISGMTLIKKIVGVNRIASN